MVYSWKCDNFLWIYKLLLMYICIIYELWIYNKLNLLFIYYFGWFSNLVGIVEISFFVIRIVILIIFLLKK